MQNILVIRLKAIGDIILTLPAVSVLRENFPNAKVTFLTSKENASLLRGFRDVNETIALDRAALRSGNPLRVVPEFFGLIHRLRTGKFSLAVDFQGFGETAWLARLTGAPQRWGTVYSKGRAWAYTRGIVRDNRMQIADFNVSLLHQCGLHSGALKNQFFVPDESLAAARSFFETNKLDPQKQTLFLQAFTSTAHKNWSPENFFALAGHFRAAGVQVIFACGPGESQALEPARKAGFVVAAGLPLLTAIGLMKLSSVIVGGVTGMVHTAVAMQKRVVMLVAAPEHEPAFPFQHRDWAVVSRKSGDITEMHLSDVIAGCERALNEQAGNASC